MATTRLPSRATKILPVAGVARIASSARRCFSAFGCNSASSVNSTPRSSTSWGRSLAVASPYWSSTAAILDVEAEMDDVAVAHDVILALEAQFPRLLRAQLATVGDEIVVGGDLG